MEDKNNNSKTMITRVAIIACLLFIAQYMYKSQSTELIHETIYNTIQDTTTIEKPNQSLSNGVVLAKSDILDQAEKKVEPAIDKNSNEPVRYEYFRDNGYTNIKSYLGFDPSRRVTRGEGGNYFANYARLNNVKKPIEKQDCAFDDLTTENGDSFIKNILQSCTYGLMRGSNGNFMPDRTMKTSEALVVLMRTKTGYLDENVDPRYLNYFNEAKKYGILSQNNDLENFDEDIDRQTFAKRIYSIMLDTE